MKIPVYAIAQASKYLGEVEAVTIEEYLEKSYQLLNDYGLIRQNISNDFEIGDTEIDESVFDDYQKQKETGE